MDKSNQIMKKTSGKRTLTIVLFAYIVLTICFYFLGGEQLHLRRTDTGNMVTPTDNVGEILSDTVLRQQFSIDADTLTDVSVFTSCFERENGCTLHLAVCRADDELGAVDIPASELGDAEVTSVHFPDKIHIVPGEVLELCVSSPDAFPGNAVSLYYGSSISVTKGSVRKQLSSSDLLQCNSQRVEGILVFQVSGTKTLLFGRIYFMLAAVLGLLLAAAGATLLYKRQKGLSSPILRLFDAFQRYRFLLEQMVNRDFKAKYKRSVLGIFWSFLNPLLMMSVQYVVFSTLFQSNIPNFPLYLLSGIVLFNFFNESTNMCLMSIVNNVNLITKVYVPKYIYPVTKLISSSINLFLSLIPLFLVMLLTHAPIRAQSILFLFCVVCLEALSLGFGMMLASMMVFFRDTQFIWSVLIMILNFATPIFYPETIIPARFMTVYRMNPLYPIVGFARTVLLEGISPEPMMYLYCLLAGLIPLAFGLWVFKKTQDSFVQNF